MKKPTLIDEVLSAAQSRRPGFDSWFDRLSPDAQADLLAVANAFDPSRHKWQSYSRAIMEAANRRGWQTSGIQGVIAWLKKHHSLKKS